VFSVAAISFIQPSFQFFDALPERHAVIILRAVRRDADRGVDLGRAQGRGAGEVRGGG
jgi:hypothetical protein